VAYNIRYVIVYHTETEEGWSVQVVASNNPLRELAFLKKSDGWTLTLVREVVCILEKLA